MLMEDSTAAISNQWCMQGNLLQFCLTSGLLSTKSMVIKLKIGKKLVNCDLFKAQNIYTFHLEVLYENCLICIFMNFNENLKNEDN